MQITTQRKQKVIAATIILWAVITAVGAYLYAFIRMRASLEEPVFDSMWGWHLLMFAIYVLPISLIILAVLLWLEYRLLSSSKGIQNNGSAHAGTPAVPGAIPSGRERDPDGRLSRTQSHQ